MKYLFIREEIYSKKLMTKLIFNSEKELFKYLKENREHIFNYGFSSPRIISGKRTRQSSHIIFQL